MIQRIQSVYLLLVTVLLVVTLCLPAGEFIGSDGIVAHVFKPLGGDSGRWWLSVYMGIVRYSFIECDYLIVHYLPIP